MNKIKRSPTLLINEKVKAMWKQGEDILHAAFGESRFPVHPDLSKALNNGISNRSYLSSLGTKRLRAKIAHYYTKKERVFTIVPIVMPNYLVQKQNSIVALDGPRFQNLYLELSKLK